MTGSDITSEIIRVVEEPQGRLIAVGDIHGCVDELSVGLDEAVSQWKLTDRDMVVFLGDYVDRGPASNRVIDRVLEFRDSFPNTYFLRGNHEDMFLSYLGLPGGSMGEMFLPNGGIQTLGSYNVDDFFSVTSVFAAIPERHISFLKELEICISCGDFLFVHAGLNPVLSLEDQNSEEMLWIRGEFLYEPHNFPQTIVFGHTPFHEIVDDRPFKIGIDTGLVFGNKLTCLNVTHGEALQVVRGGRRALPIALARL